MGGAGQQLRAAKYRRISDDREGRELGLNRQNEDLDNLAARRGYRVVASYADNDVGASTRSTKPRPGYDRLLRDARAGAFDVILAYTASRLTRRPLEHEALIQLAERYSVSFDYVSSPQFDLNTADGRQMARMLAAQDAAESERISERVARARLGAARSGRVGSGGERPFGFHDDRVTIDDGEAMVIREAAASLLAGIPLAQIVRDMREQGIPTVTGADWSPSVLRGILLSPRTAGLVVYRGEVLEGTSAAWQPIVPRDQWDAIRSILTDPQRRTQRGTLPRWLGSGIYRCGHPACADVHPRSTMVVTTSNQSAGRAAYPAYRCSRRAHLSRAAEPLDDAIARVIIARLAKPDAVDLIPSRDADNARSQRVKLSQRAETLRRKLAGAKQLWRDDVFSDAEYKTERADLERQLVAVDGELQRLAAVSPLDGIAGAPDAGERWEALGLGRRRAILAALLVVTVLPSKRRGRPPKGQQFDPAGVRVDPVTDP